MYGFTSAGGTPVGAFGEMRSMMGSPSQQNPYASSGGQPGMAMRSMMGSPSQQNPSATSGGQPGMAMRGR